MYICTCMQRPKTARWSVSILPRPPFLKQMALVLGTEKTARKMMFGRSQMRCGCKPRSLLLRVKDGLSFYLKSESRLPGLHGNWSTIKYVFLAYRKFRGNVSSWRVSGGILEGVFNLIEGTFHWQGLQWREDIGFEVPIRNHGFEIWMRWTEAVEWQGLHVPCSAFPRLLQQISDECAVQSSVPAWTRGCIGSLPS